MPWPLLVQEIELLFNQCTVRADSTDKVVKDWIRRDILALGAATSAEAQMDLGLAGGDHTRFGSPWYLFLYLQYHSGIRVVWREVLDNPGGTTSTLLSLSLPERRLYGGEGSPPDQSTPPGTRLARRRLALWRRQLHALMVTWLNGRAPGEQRSLLLKDTLVTFDNR